MSVWPKQIGLVGCGAMGAAFARGLRRGASGSSVVCADAVPAVAIALAADIGGRTGSIAECAACDVVVVAVKPKDVAELLAAMAPDFGADSVLVSVVAGWDLARLAAAAGDRAIVRTMPNLAVRDGVGLVATASRGLNATQRADLARLFSALGTVEELAETQFAAATALAGSGPGFVALMAEGLEEGAVASGFSREQARRMVQAVLAGTAALLAEPIDPAALRQRVSSPGGTTVEGVAVLERGAVRAHFADAVRAAARRAGEL